MNIRTKIISGVIAVAVMLSLAAPLGAQTARAVDPASEAKNGLDAAGASGDDKSGGRFNSLLRVAVNLLLFIIGAVSVIMIIIGGLRYVISNGDSSQVTSAKNTVLYAVIGLLIALFAYAIVGFVIDKF